MTGWDFVMMWMLSGIAMAATFGELTGLGRRMPAFDFIFGAAILGTLGGPLWALPLGCVLIDLLNGVSLKEIREKSERGNKER